MKKALKIGCFSVLGLFVLFVILAILLPDPVEQVQTPQVSSPPVQSAPIEVEKAVESSPPKSEFEIMVSRAAHSVHATQLADEYKDNEFAADEKYKNKIVLVRGNITHFSEVFGTATVQLEAGLITNIVCNMKKSQKPLLAQLKKGQDVLIVGKVTGKSLGIGMSGCLVGLPAK